MTPSDPIGQCTCISVCISPYAAPSAPLNLTFPPRGVLNDSVKLTLLPPENPNGVVRFYQLKQSYSGGSITVNTSDNTTTMLVLSNLVPATQYNISVRAFTIAFGPFSDQLSVHTADGEEIDPIDALCNCEMDVIIRRMNPCLPLLHIVPLMPQDVAGNSFGSTTIMVTWMEPPVSFRECIYTSITRPILIV